MKKGGDKTRGKGGRTPDETIAMIEADGMTRLHGKPEYVLVTPQALDKPSASHTLMPDSISQRADDAFKPRRNTPSNLSKLSSEPPIKVIKQGAPAENSVVQRPIHIITDPAKPK